MDEKSVGVIRDRTPPNLTGEDVERVLHEYFAGKRDSLRTYKFIEAKVEGKLGTFTATAFDVSRSGVLLRILDADFATAAEDEQLMPYTAKVWKHFDNGLSLRFDIGDVEATADVVRVTGYSGADRHLILIGCRFRSPLSQRQCDRLGISFDEDQPEPE